MPIKKKKATKKSKKKTVAKPKKKIATKSKKKITKKPKVKVVEVIKRVRVIRVKRVFAKTEEEARREAKRLGCFHFNQYLSQWEIILTDGEYRKL